MRTWIIVGIVFVSIGMSKTLSAEKNVFPGKSWQETSPAHVGLDPAKLDEAAKYAQSAGGSGMIVRGGKVVLAWGDLKKRYDIKSSTKSIGLTALGLALDDGKIKSMSDKASAYHGELGRPPVENVATGWLDKITIAHLATQTAGFAKPGGYEGLMFEPGTKWLYSDGGPNWLAECITLQYKRDLKDLLFERVFSPIGIRSVDLTWRRNAYRPAKIKGIARREFGAGISANVDALARIGLLYLRGGKWNGRQLVGKSFVSAVSQTPKAVKGLKVVGEIGAKPLATSHYGLLWWSNADGVIEGVPKDAYWSWGLYDSHIIVIPSLDMVVARAGKSWKRNGTDDYKVFGKFLRPIAAAATSAAPGEMAPYPPSKVITRLTWADKSTIVRIGPGSDNWPLTWADDDMLYTAYGDGWGFVPKVAKKLSMGFGRVEGPATNFKGVNIRSTSGERIGDGRRGAKASGILMVDSVLYMWTRNATKAGRQCRLVVSADKGKTWTWSDWKLPELGYCTFINFGRNYAGARDEYVYSVSHNHPSAYEFADSFCLMRVPKTKLTDRSAYEFLASVSTDNKPTWTKDIAKRGAVFTNKGNCRRSGITYSPALKRYIWWQGQPSGRERFEGGFGVYDAPEPWGPWTTVYHTAKWDVGPGETGSFPTKWMSSGGKSMYLVFSGEDYFSVRKATVTTARDESSGQ